MEAKKTTALVFVLGVWLGSSILLLWVVGSSFPGVERAVVENNRLAGEAGIEFRPMVTAPDLGFPYEGP